MIQDHDFSSFRFTLALYVGTLLLGVSYYFVLFCCGRIPCAVPFQSAKLSFVLLLLTFYIPCGTMWYLYPATCLWPTRIEPATSQIPSTCHDPCQSVPFQLMKGHYPPKKPYLPTPCHQSCNSPCRILINPVLWIFLGWYAGVGFGESTVSSRTITYYHLPFSLSLDGHALRQSRWSCASNKFRISRTFRKPICNAVAWHESRWSPIPKLLEALEELKHLPKRDGRDGSSSGSSRHKRFMTVWYCSLRVQNYAYL